MSKSYARRISDAQVMYAGLQAHTDQLARRGINEDFLNTLSSNEDFLNTLSSGTSAAIVLNNEQEKLKAQLKAKTAELDAQLTALEKQMSEAKKIVKMDFPKTDWKEFGILDKQ